VREEMCAIDQLKGGNDEATWRDIS
jgi:hypothetical protein